MKAVVHHGIGDIRLTRSPIPGSRNPPKFTRVPYAMTTLVRVPDSLSHDDVILLSDIYPTAWFGARLAEVGAGDTVAIFGAGVVRRS